MNSFHERLTIAGSILHAASRLLADMNIVLVTTVMLYEDESGDVAYGVALREEGDLNEVCNVLTQMANTAEAEQAEGRVH